MGSRKVSRRTVVKDLFKHPSNGDAWAIGVQRSNGFHIRRIVWGLLMAQCERRAGEQVRRATILVERKFKRRADLMRRNGWTRST